MATLSPASRCGRCPGSWPAPATGAVRTLAEPPFGAAADSLAVGEPAVPIWLIGASSAGGIGRQRPVPGAAGRSKAAIMACAAKWP